MMVIAVILHTIVFLCCCSPTTENKSVLRNATTVAGQPVVLNCVMPVSRVQQNVVWLRPTDGLPVPLHTHRADDRTSSPRRQSDTGLAARFVVIGNTTAGHHHLLIRYTVFREDTGLWTCVSVGDNRLVQHIRLTVLVPPATQVPEVIPVVVNVSLSHSSANDIYTVSCVAHFAFPPVDLVWVKEYGPSVKYSVSPPRMLVSRAGTVSSRVTLVLTSANTASLFACIASHPTFAGDVGRQTVQFMLPSGTQLAHTQALQLDAAAKPSITHRSRQMDEIDRACLLTVVILVGCCLVVGLVLSKCTTDWQFSAASEQTLKSDTCSESVNAERTSMIDSEQAADDTDARVKPWPSHRRDRCKLVMFVVMAVLLMSSLVLCFPVYLKEVTTPITGTDEVQAVFAGAALWLDCTLLVQPVDSLVQVSWTRDNELLYYQYLVNDRLVSYPPNTTAGVMFHARASSQTVGQVTVWPVAPGEGGVYSCHVVMSGTGDASNVERHKTITVFVFSGAVVNSPLLVCQSVAVISAASLIALVLHHTVTCRCTASTSLSRNQDNRDETRLKNTSSTLG